MNTLNKYDSIDNLIFNEGLKILTIEFADSSSTMLIQLNNGLILVTPIYLFPKLKNANKKSLKNFELIAGSTAIHWPDLDEDLSLKGFLEDYLRQKLQTEREFILA